MTMTPERFRYLLRRQIKLNGTYAAQVLGLNRTSVERFMSGEYPIPDYIAEAMEELAAHIVRIRRQLQATKPIRP